MALKNSIKHFKDVNGYSEVIKKEDIDNNFDLLADEIDEIIDEINTPFENNDLSSFSDVFSAGIKTANDTQTDVSNITLKLKSANTITIIGSILQDDYTTKWSFERVLAVTVKDDGSVTIASDDNTDNVKDDTDWAFDVTSTDDTTNPYLTMKATGKADTNIIWGVEVKNKFTNWK